MRLSDIIGNSDTRAFSFYLERYWRKAAPPGRRPAQTIQPCWNPDPECPSLQNYEKEATQSMVFCCTRLKSPRHFIICERNLKTISERKVQGRVEYVTLTWGKKVQTEAKCF